MKNSCFLLQLLVGILLVRNEIRPSEPDEMALLLLMYCCFAGCQCECVVFLQLFLMDLDLVKSCVWKRCGK